MDKHFDVIIIGSGPGGMAAAYDLESAGKKVAVVEKDKWGGTCPNRGCDPKKILYHGVEARRTLEQLSGHGYLSVPSVDWEALMAFKTGFTSAVPHNQMEGLKSAGINTLTGAAAFKDEHTIVVNREEYTADSFILATGQRPFILDIPGKEYLETSTDFLEMPHLPKSMIFVGGGYITFELAAIAHQSGSQVHIIHHNEQPLKAFDDEQSEALIQLMKDSGIVFHFNETAAQVNQEKQLLSLTCESGLVLEAEKIICAAGRIPNIENMNLDGIGVEYSHKGIKTNEYLQTKVSNIYALGDCLEKEQPKLTPVSSFEGSYLAKRMSGETANTIQYPQIPTILFGLSKLAQVGNVRPAKEEQDFYEIKELDLSGWFTYTLKNEQTVKAKIVIEKDSGMLAGASVLGSEADQLINLLTVAINEQLTSDKLNQLIMLYPTAGSDISYLY